MRKQSKISGVRMMLCLALALGAAPSHGGEMRKPAILEGVRKILFYGDSLTDGSSYPDYVVNTLRRVWPEAGFEVMNAAICGNTAADLVRRLKKDVLARHPDLVSIAIGTNDCLRDRPVDEYRADLETLVTNLLAAGSRVVLVRPSPFGGEAKEQQFQAYLAAIDAVAREHGLLVADAHAEFLRGAAAGREMLGSDGIHHGKDGFEGMARALLDAFGLQGVEMDKAVKPWPGLLTDWESSDPVPLDGDYDPAEAAAWKRHDAASLAAQQTWCNAPFTLRGGWMPFADPDSKRAAYGRTFFDAPEAGEYELCLGGSPELQVVWLNGSKVWTASELHGYHPDADFVAVRMRKGRNEIVVASNFLIFVGVRSAGNTGCNTGRRPAASS